jgi:hypothetical protein
VVVPLFNIRVAVVDTMMTKARDVENVVDIVAVSIDDRVRHDLLADDRQQRLALQIGRHHGIDFSAAFEDAEHRYLAGGAAAMFAFAMAAKVAFIDLNLPRYRRTGLDLAGDYFAQPVVEIGRRFAVHTSQIGRHPSRHAGDEKFRQARLLFFR